MNNDEIRSLLIGGITEDYFIQNFDDIIVFTGFNRFVPFGYETGSLAKLERVWITECLERIYRMNTTNNKWADISNISDNLKLFLKLRGEEI